MNGTSGSVAPQRQKRVQILAACDNCKRRKVKCDTRRPCGECQRREQECDHFTKPRETVQRATRRKYEELHLLCKDLQTLYYYLASGEEGETSAILSRMRRGDAIEAIVDDLRQGQPQRTERTEVERLPSKRDVRQTLAVALLESTASTSELLSSAPGLMVAETRLKHQIWRLRSTQMTRPINLEALNDILMEANRSSYRALQGLTDPSEATVSLAGLGQDALQDNLPVSHWTSLVSKTEEGAASSFIVLFFNFINPYWRFVDEGPFLNALHGQAPSRFCSALLVNAVLACASLYSRNDLAFDRAGDLLTRGEHFHREAVRLWTDECGKASLTNVQAILALSMSSSFRGKDKLGYSFGKTAGRLAQRLMLKQRNIPFAADSAYMNAVHRVCNSAVWFDVTYTTGLMRGSDELLPRFPGHELAADQQSQALAASVTHPLQDVPKLLNQGLLVSARYTLLCLNLEVLHMVTPLETVGAQQYDMVNVADALVKKLHAWHENLPTQLSQREDMPSPLFELHGQYYCILMTAYDRALHRIATRSDLDNTDEVLQNWQIRFQTGAVEAALSSSTLLQHYREAYGVSILAPFLMQTASLAMHILIPVLVRSAVTTHINFLERADAAFTECFRCLLAIGMGLMLPRAMVRLIYHTAQVLDVQLPFHVQEMLRMVIETAWQPSDLHLLHSSYPNWAIARHRRESAEHFAMEDMLHQWESLTVEDEKTAMESEDERTA